MLSSVSRAARASSPCRSVEDTARLVSSSSMLCRMFSSTLMTRRKAAIATICVPSSSIPLPLGSIFASAWPAGELLRSEEHTSELQSHSDLVCRLLLEKKKKKEQANRLLSAKHDGGVSSHSCGCNA